MIRRSKLAVMAGALALLALTSSCSYLRDAEPWDQTVQYRVDSIGNFIVEPLVIQGDLNYGLVHVVNDTGEKRGFAIRELAVFEEIPAGLTVTVQVDEAKDGETYVWEDHLNPGLFEGKLVIEYVDPEFRDR